MKIEITADSAVADGKGNRYRRGQTVEVDDTLAQSWIDAGHAVKAAAGRASSGETKASEPETATNEPPRNTATRSTRKKSSE